LTFQNPAVLLHTTRYNIQQFYMVLALSWVFVWSQNKQRLFPYTALTDWFL
jgi:hypothetical protein